MDVFESSACGLDLTFGGCPFRFMVAVWLGWLWLARFGLVCRGFLDWFDLGGHEHGSVVCIKKCFMWLVDMGKGLWW